MKLLLLFVLAGGSVYTLAAQHLERTVTGSAGDYQSHPTAGSLHWTAGEITVEEFQNGQVLSQGFQQGTIEIISAIDEQASYGERVTVKVFPNPTSGWIQVETDLRGNPEVTLTDLLGRHLLTHTITPTDEIIDLQPLPPGIYLLRIMRKGQPIRTFRIQKVDS